MTSGVDCSTLNIVSSIFVTPLGSFTLLYTFQVACLRSSTPSSDSSALASIFLRSSSDLPMFLEQIYSIIIFHHYILRYRIDTLKTLIIWSTSDLISFKKNLLKNFLYKHFFFYIPVVLHLILFSLVLLSKNLKQGVCRISILPTLSVIWRLRSWTTHPPVLPLNSIFQQKLIKFW